MLFRKRIKEKEMSPTGVNLVGNPEYNRGNVLLGLLARGLAVFFIVYGSIGCFVSSLNVEYNELVVGIALFVVSFYLAFIFYKPWIKNVGYILIFFVFAFGVGGFATAINSGFYALVNVFFSRVEIILDLPGVMEYTEQITNRIYTITICLSFLGAGMCVLINMFVSNVMSILRTLTITLPMAIVGSYIGLKPNIIYAILLLSGYMLVYVMKRSGHYRGNGKNEEFRVVSRKDITKYFYHSDGKIMIQLGAFLVVVAMIFTLAMLVIFPSGNISVPSSWDYFRNDSDYVLSVVAMSGINGLFDGFEEVGGMKEGELGNVGNVHLDYQTDLIVKLTPYTYNTIYLRSFVGVNYTSQRWLSNGVERKTFLKDDDDKHSQYEKHKTSLNKEYNQLRENFDNGANGSAKGKMSVENVDADEYSSYIPYYSELEDGTYTAFWCLDSYVGPSMYYGNTYYFDYYLYNDKIEYHNEIEADPEYLLIPDDNVDVIKEFCENAGFGGTDEEIIEQVRDYFQENIPYTLRPGRLPKNEDYVNYFLTKNQKGFCVHFATAATLIFRYCGIPARYIEGYVIPYEKVLNGEIIDGADYNNWFEGDNPLGETALVEVEIDDSKAHAWVEVYDPDFGWRVVEVTPYSFELEDEGGDFWSFFGGGINFSGNVGGNGQGLSEFSIGRFGIVIFVALGVLLIYILYKVIVRLLVLVRRKRSFNTKDYSINIVNIYAHLCAKIRREDNDFNTMTSHNMQLKWIITNCEDVSMDIERMTRILQQASYSNETINSNDYVYIRATLLGILKKLKFIK